LLLEVAQWGAVHLSVRDDGRLLFGASIAEGVRECGRSIFA
jgi:hypothetical protein